MINSHVLPTSSQRYSRQNCLRYKTQPSVRFGGSVQGALPKLKKREDSDSWQVDAHPEIEEFPKCEPYCAGECPRSVIWATRLSYALIHPAQLKF
jgi:hypothetical protein